MGKAVGQGSAMPVTKPVVVNVETTANAPWRKASTPPTALCPAST